MTGDEPFTLWRGSQPSWLEREHVEIAPGAARSCAEPLWGGALVVVEHGRVVLAAASGREVELAQGAVFSVHRLRDASLYNRGRRAVVLSVVHRAAQSA